MQKISRQIRTEILWLTLSLGLTTTLAFFLFGRTFLTGTLDIHLHDTYFVFAPLHILLPMFFLVTFVVYYIKEFRRSFQHSLPNWILIITGLALVAVLTLATKVFAQLFTGGLTVYPPLSALETENVPALSQDPAANVITNFFIVLQLLILALLLYAAYRWGRHKRIEH